MTNFMQIGTDWLMDQLKEHCSVAVTLARGASSTSIQATPGKKIYRFVGEDGSQFRVESHDWLVEVADYAFDSVAVEPKVGDQFTWELGGKTYTYTVAKVGGEPCCEHSDPFKKKWRVHSNLTGEE